MSLQKSIYDQTTLITTTNNSMPKVSYIKGFDVFLNFCFVMVFASLVEYAVVSYFNKKIQRRGRRRRLTEALQQATEIPIFSNSMSIPNDNYLYYTGGIPPAHSMKANGSRTTRGLSEPIPIPQRCDCRPIPYNQMPTAETYHLVPLVKPPKSRGCHQITPSKIDKCSRSLFPFLFIIFQIGFWSIMAILSRFDGNQTYILFKDEEH